MMAEQKLDKKYISSFKHVIIYGAGVTGLSYLKVLKNAGILVECFLDKNENIHNTLKDETIVKSPEDEFSQEFKNNSCVIVAVSDKIYNSDEIISYLLDLGYKTVIDSEHFFSIFHVEMWDNTNVEFPGYSYYENNVDKIQKSRILFKEKESLKLFDNIIDYKRTLDYSYSPQAGIYTKYFPKDIEGLKIPKIFIDCGIYSGNDLISLNSNFGQMDAIYAFEPDPVNFANFPKSFFEESNKFSKSFCMYPCAVWSKTTFMRFSSNKNTASEISENGDIVMQCVALDDVIYNIPDSYIVMDIEGAEFEALLGAEKIIKKFKPTLGISIMHKSSDLCEIPILINSWNLGYSFYLRTHAPCFGNMVLYAIPN